MLNHLHLLTQSGRCVWVFVTLYSPGSLLLSICDYICICVHRWISNLCLRVCAFMCISCVPACSGCLASIFCCTHLHRACSTVGATLLGHPVTLGDEYSWMVYQRPVFFISLPGGSSWIFWITNTSGVGAHRGTWDSSELGRSSGRGRGCLPLAPQSTLNSLIPRSQDHRW